MSCHCVQDQEVIAFYLSIGLSVPFGAKIGLQGVFEQVVARLPILLLLL